MLNWTILEKPSKIYEKFFKGGEHCDFTGKMRKLFLSFLPVSKVPAGEVLLRTAGLDTSLMSPSLPPSRADDAAQQPSLVP